VKISDPDAKVDCVIVTVAHDEFRGMGLPDAEGLTMSETSALVAV